ncbi:protein FAM178B isoform X2 [Monodelphis domestica]|uniref:protein FAM178B isoform X2 n=1 Tax=Monodelphis domestica TaxID=13616 RepID=UPI0024E20FEC|nr:protein FAM178B isoform X2 [Monodelphis domestica]XP_056669039.1 protein FAM178B isoform X2 [Monodelphis domestica]XP_056669040.1 protein FAM178B isoform X2 [Monodelphis domestica]
MDWDKTTRSSRASRGRKSKTTTSHHEGSQSNSRALSSQLPSQEHGISDGTQDHHKKPKMDTLSALDELHPSWLSPSRNTNTFSLIDEGSFDLFPKDWSPPPIEFLYQKPPDPSPSPPPILPQALEENTENNMALATGKLEATSEQDRENAMVLESTDLSQSPKTSLKDADHHETLSYAQELPFLTHSGSCLSESSYGLNEESLQLDSEPEEELVTLEELFQNMAAPGQRIAAPAFEPHDSLDFRNSDSYVNSLDCLLLDKRNQILGRDDWENSFLGGDSALAPLKNFEDDYGILTPEHRLLVEKFCVKLYMIPTLHPGEVVFLSQNHLPCTLDCTNLVPQNSLEELFFSSTFAQQISFLNRGLLGYLYLQTPSCPVPVLQWLFQLLAWPIETSAGAFRVLWNLSMDGLSRRAGGDNTFVWCPKLQEIIMTFQSLGARGSNLYLKASLQPMPSLHDRRVHETANGMSSREQEGSTLETELETNLSYICKFLTLCVMAQPGAYTDGELLNLMYLICRASLDRQLRLLPSTDLQQLLLMLLEDVKDWSEKLPELCCMLSWVSDHHHNLLAAVQLVLDVTTRGRQLRGRLSLVIIARLLGQMEVLPLCKETAQLSLLCHLLGLMKPSSLGQYLSASSPGLQNQKQQLEVNTELDQEVCYLCHTLLTLAGMVVSSQSITTDKWGELQQLCVQLERQVTTHIHESPQAMYRTKLKDLAAQMYIRWQELLTQCRPQDQYYNP